MADQAGQTELAGGEVAPEVPANPLPTQTEGVGTPEAIPQLPDEAWWLRRVFLVEGITGADMVVE